MRVFISFITIDAELGG